ncbi:hypothetical protein ABPG72_019321 [Tetrahymena utriculariae]
MLAGLGKFILVLSLCLQCSMLIQGIDAQSNFNTNMDTFSKALPQLSIIAQYSQFYDYIRFALAGLYGFSILILVTPSCFVPLVSALGIVLNTAITYLPVLLKDPQNELATIAVLKNVCILGGLFYLMGSSCPKACKPKTA